MVYIIYGGVDEGKTTEMAFIYKQLKQGDGFISKKIFKNQKNCIGYEIVRLATGEARPLAYKTTYLPPRWDEIYRCGPYSFSKKALTFARGIINDLITRFSEPIFMDEIGPLELAGKGFSSILEKALRTQKDIYITVRNNCVSEVIKKFAIRDKKRIKVKNTDEKTAYIYFK